MTVAGTEHGGDKDGWRGWIDAVVAAAPSGRSARPNRVLGSVGAIVESATIEARTRFVCETRTLFLRIHIRGEVIKA